MSALVERMLTPRVRTSRGVVGERRLRARHEAALRVLRHSGGDGPLLLSYVIWPTAAFERAVEAYLSPREKGVTQSE